MDAKLLTIIGTVVPTMGYFVATMGFSYQGLYWNASLWFFYACANIALMKLNGLF